MKDIQEVSAYIRFQLDQLSANNAHHGFEDLCFHLTQARICSNILPATGPVSKGGDQGRDFETFKTDLKSSPIANSTFIGLKSDKRIAFSCSTAKDIINKIKRDVKSILSHKLPCDKIIYFCTENVISSDRHKLQQWVEEKYSIPIEIFDGKAITNLLVDRELFWIAVKYLDVSSEIYPRHDDEKDWYIKSLEYWKADEAPLLNYASFYEIKESMRHAVFITTKAKQDIPFWIETLEKFMNDDFGIDIKRRAMYEISVASYRGLGTLIDRESMLREFFNMIHDLKSVGELEDFGVILTYCIHAACKGLVTLEADELKNWHNLLLEKIDEKLKTADDINLKCKLLELRGFSHTKPLDKCFEIEADEVMLDWVKLVDLVENAPLFPINNFSNGLIKLTKFLSNHPKYEYLSKKVDELLSKRYGDHIAARNCVDRAVEFYENGEILKAINQLHEAKVKWFIKETLYNSLISAHLISNSYLDLGLSFAAKYYALAAAYIAQSSSDQLMKAFIPRALSMAARCEYKQGSWCGFLELMNIAIKEHLAFSKDPLGDNIPEELKRALSYTSILIFVSKSFFEEPLNSFVVNMINEWPFFKDDVNKSASELQNESVDTIDDIWLASEEQLNGRPFGDCGSFREVSWSELGIIWNVKWENDYVSTAISEQFIAILQIFLADLAGIDLCLLKTDVNISIAIDDIKKPKVEAVPSNNGRIWKIIFPSYENFTDMDKLQRQFLSIISHVLYEVSLLPSYKLDKIIKNCLEKGILNKVFIAESYLNLYKFFIDSELFKATERALKTVPELDRSFKIKSHEELKWFDGPGPGYSKEEAIKHLKTRYNRSIIPIKQTLKRLSEDPEFVSTVERLRANGWLDWHILLVMNNIAVTYRIDQNMEEYPLPPYVDGNIQYQIEKDMVLNEEEKENSTVIPVSIFNEDDLRLCLHVTMIDTLRRVYGLECKQMTPDMDAIEHFLGERYNYWKDDIGHEKLF